MTDSYDFFNCIFYLLSFWTQKCSCCLHYLTNVKYDTEFPSLCNILFLKIQNKHHIRITSGFGGGEFTKTLRKVCTCQKMKFSFLLLEYCKIRECYAVANAFTIRNMYSLFLYMKCNQNQLFCLCRLPAVV
jgi:hypothetical protein